MRRKREGEARSRWSKEKEVRKRQRREEMATFSFRGHKAHVSFIPAITRVHVSTAGRRGNGSEEQRDARKRERERDTNRGGGRQERRARTARLHARQYITRVIQFVGIYCSSIPARVPPRRNQLSRSYRANAALAFAVRSRAFDKRVKSSLPFPLVPHPRRPIVFMQFTGIYIYSLGAFLR